MKKKILTIATLLVVSLIIGVLGTTVMADELVGASVKDATADDTKIGAGIKDAPTVTSWTNNRSCLYCCRIKNYWRKWRR